MCTKQIEYQFSPLKGGYTFQATQAKSRESELHLYTTFTFKENVKNRFLDENKNTSTNLYMHQTKVSSIF